MSDNIPEKTREQIIRENQIELWSNLDKVRCENSFVNNAFKVRCHEGLSDTHMLLILTDALLKQNKQLVADLLHKKSISVDPYFLG